MKSLTFKELDLIVDVADSYQGFFVQEVQMSQDVLFMALRLGSKPAHLIVDVSSAKPVFLATQEPLPPFKKEVKPLSLFLKAHLIGKKLIHVERKSDWGRLVHLRFENSESFLEMDLHLFPQARNIIVRTDKSKMSWDKIKELQTVSSTMVDESPRQPEQVFADWLSERKGSKTVAASIDPQAKFKKALEKKQQGLNSLKKKIEELKDEGLEKAILWLEEHRELEVPLELSEFIDPKKTLRQNIAGLYEKRKAHKKKLESVYERITILENEIAQMSPSDFENKKTFEKAASPLVEAKGRTKNFENGVSAYIGKTAADNLKILRKAKAWYIWVHPKDIPGSHAIIALQKGAALDSHILRQVALWTLQETLSAKQFKDWEGVKCEFIYTECRFVTPIRGDKVGRVNYKNEKTLTLTVPISR